MNIDPFVDPMIKILWWSSVWMANYWFLKHKKNELGINFVDDHTLRHRLTKYNMFARIQISHVAACRLVQALPICTSAANYWLLKYKRNSLCWKHKWTYLAILATNADWTCTNYRMKKYRIVTSTKATQEYMYSHVQHVVGIQRFDCSKVLLHTTA